MIPFWWIGVGVLMGLGALWWLTRQLRWLVQRMDQTTELKLAGLTQVWEQKLSESVRQNAELVTKAQGDMTASFQRTSEVLGQLNKELGQQSELNRQLLEVGQKLEVFQQMLHAPKFRGTEGELMLGNLLRQIFPNSTCFVEQYRFSDGAQVDAVIKVGEHLLPIDAKFPLESFVRLMKAQDEEEKQVARREFVPQVKRHITSIATKYVRPAEGTFDFAFMYIPLENVYYEMIIKEQEGELGSLPAFAREKRVFPVSPNTLFPYLSIVLIGLRGLAIEEQAKLILQRLNQLQRLHQELGQTMGTLGDHLKNAQGSLERAKLTVGRIGGQLEVLAPVPGEFPGQRALEIEPVKEEV